MVGKPRASKWVFFSSYILKPMEKKPNSDEDYIIVFVRLPTRLLLQLGRWILVASSMYVLLHK